MLTIAEELLLLSHDGSRGFFHEPPQLLRDTVLAGAVLMELALRSRIDADLDGLVEIDPTPTGEPALDHALGKIAAATESRSTAASLDLLRSDGLIIRDLSIGRLVERGVVRRQDDRFLWVLETRRYPLIDDGPLLVLKARIAGLLLSQEIPDPREIVIIVLADSCGLLSSVLPESDLRRAQRRIEQIARLDLIGQALRSTLAELLSTITKMTAFPS